MAEVEVKVPDIGDFKDVPVITVFVKPGDTVKKDDPLLELESDKATMEVEAVDEGEVPVGITYHYYWFRDQEQDGLVGDDAARVRIDDPVDLLAGQADIGELFVAQLGQGLAGLPGVDPSLEVPQRDLDRAGGGSIVGRSRHPLKRSNHAFRPCCAQVMCDL